MSEYFLCKGEISQDKLKGVIIEYHPFEDFFNQICEYFWKNENKENIWTMDIDEDTAFDNALTEAQRQINDGVVFEETAIYESLKQLLDYDVEIVMWYDEFYDDIPVVYSEADFFKAVYDGITDKSGMCEVYVRYKNIKN